MVFHADCQRPNRRALGNMLAVLGMLGGFFADAAFSFNRGEGAAVGHRPAPAIPNPPVYQGRTVQDWRKQLLAPNLTPWVPPLDYPLRGNCDPAAIQVTLHLLRDPLKEIRLQAAVCLTILGLSNQEAVAGLTVATRDSCDGVRAVALHALGVIGQPTADVQAAMVVAMQDANITVRFAAARAYWHLTKETTRPVSCLCDIIRRSSRDIRQYPLCMYAIEFVGTIQPKYDLVGDVLTDILMKKEVDVGEAIRAKAAQTIGRTRSGTLRAVRPLLSGATDPEHLVREASGEALVMILLDQVIQPALGGVLPLSPARWPPFGFVNGLGAESKSGP